MPTPIVIAIDGPSGSGKSSTARGVARELGLAYLDTGAMYRAAAIAFAESGLSLSDPERVARLVADAGIAPGTDPAEPTIALAGRDVTQAIRDPEVSAAVSSVATLPPVRDVLRRHQRDIIEAEGRRIVVEGRDITTVVAPDADLRLLLVADPAARMARREAELHGTLSAEQLRDQVLRRDRDDATVSQFETAADGVVTLDSTQLSLDEVIAAVVGLVRERGLA